jgi:hypothetical protein
VQKYHWVFLGGGEVFKISIINLQKWFKKSTRSSWEELIAYFPWYDTGHIENDASNQSFIDACVFVTAVTFLLSRWLATIGGFLPSRCPATIGEFLTSRCLETRGGYTDTHTRTAMWSHKPTLFFQNRESGLKPEVKYSKVVPGHTKTVKALDFYSGDARFEYRLWHQQSRLGLFTVLLSPSRRIPG